MSQQVVSDWTVESLHVGTFEIDDATIPIFCFLIEGRGRRVLVDAGTPEPEVVQNRWKTNCQFGGAQALESALNAAEVKASQIDVLVLSHLHFDHSGNVDLFPEAQVIVHRSELLHAIDPVPTQRGSYGRDITSRVVARSRPAHLLIVDSRQHEILPGVRTVHIAGHTPGVLGVIVNTGRGRVGIPSDAGETYGRWYPADQNATAEPLKRLSDTFSPPRVRSEGERETLEAMRAFRAQCDIVVPSHDWRIPRHLPSQWWELPRSKDLSVESEPDD